MADSNLRALSEHERAQMRQWLDNWRRVGPLLEQERVGRMRALTDDDAWLESQALFELWEPTMTGDAGEGLLLQQAVFAQWRNRRKR